MQKKKKRGTCTNCHKRRLVTEIKKGIGAGGKYCKECEEDEPNLGNRFFLNSGVEIFARYGEPKY
jgi:transcription elongation factor Elf1